MENALRVALGIFSGKDFFSSATPENLRIFRSCLFTRGAVAGSGIGCCQPMAVAQREPKYFYGKGTLSGALRQP